MRKSLLLALLLLSVATYGFADNPKNNHLQSDQVEQELKQIEETRRRAIKNGDMKTLDAIYADDFQAIAGTGTIVDKTRLMTVFKNNAPAINFTTDEIQIRRFGETAVFLGRLTGRNASGEILSAARFTHIFVKRGGKWRIVAGQSTPIAKT